MEYLRDRYGDAIKVVSLDVNRRVAFATNSGFAASNGSYIAMLGDDDYWTDRRKIAKQIAIFEGADEKLGVVGTWWSEHRATGETELRAPEPPEHWVDRLLQGGGIICGSTPLIRREAWQAVGGLDLRMPRGTDSDLFRGIVVAGYGAAVLREDTTTVDVGHGKKRMTTAGGFREARRTAYAHGYLLWKYRGQSIRHPRAMFVRLRSLVLAPLVAILR